jgi:hypothetical protein
MPSREKIIMNLIYKFIFTLILISGLLACKNASRDLENYGESTRLSNGTTLQYSYQHQGGWKRTECLLCHNASLGIHRGPNSTIDAEALNELVRQNGGSAYCKTCHGANGG